MGRWGRLVQGERQSGEGGVFSSELRTTLQPFPLTPPHSSQGGQQQRSLSSSSAKDTNNNCNGNGEPLNQFTTELEAQL